MSVIVVSNRVARAKTDEPIAGGLASALIPMVRGIRRDLGRLQRSRRRRGADNEFLRQDRSARQRRARDGRHAGANIIAAITKASPIRRCGRRCIRGPISFRSRPRNMRPTARSTLSWRALVALQCTADASSGSRIIISSRWAQNCAGSKMSVRSDSSCTRRGRSAAPWRRCRITPIWCEAMLAYDLIGFQTDDDRKISKTICSIELGLDGGRRRRSRRITGVTQLATFPIGIDVEEFAARAAKAVDTAGNRAAAREPAGRQARARRRPSRLFQGPRQPHARVRPHARHRAVAQSATCRCCRSPCRRAATSAPIGELKHELAALGGRSQRPPRRGRLDARSAISTRAFAQSTLAGFYRVAQVGLVTPLHDGMNLVAKEYVAAQNPFDPGVLVLSAFAGAAKELDAALLVNPHDIDGMARQIAARARDGARGAARALAGDGRASCGTASVQVWFADFLAGARRQRARAGRARSAAGRRHAVHARRCRRRTTVQRTDGPASEPWISEYSPRRPRRNAESC